MGIRTSEFMMIKIEPKIWEQMVAHSIEHYPSEACGILAGPKEGREGTIFYPCKNIYDEMHEKAPETYPRTSKTAYLMDGAEQQALFDKIAGDGLAVQSIVHSHPDHDAYFSEEDRLAAAPWGEPFYPEISYIVISIWDRTLKEANDFLWNAETQDFDEFKIV